MSGIEPGQESPGHQALAKALDRLEFAMGRIARAPRAAAEPRAFTLQPDRIEDVAGRLDALIAELRRALAGEQN